LVVQDLIGSIMKLHHYLYAMKIDSGEVLIDI